MPEYLYRCTECQRERVKIHSMFVAPIYMCCNKEMVRKPQAQQINWNGLRPSAGELSHTLREHIDNAPRRRDEITQRSES